MIVVYRYRLGTQCPFFLYMPYARDTRSLYSTMNIRINTLYFTHPIHGENWNLPSITSCSREPQDRPNVHARERWNDGEACDASASLTGLEKPNKRARDAMGREPEEGRSPQSYRHPRSIGFPTETVRQLGVEFCTPRRDPRAIPIAMQGFCGDMAKNLKRAIDRSRFGLKIPPAEG